MTKSQASLLFCLSFIAGISIDSIITTPQTVLLGLLIFGVFLVAIFWEEKRVVVAGLCLLFLAVGIWRHDSLPITPIGFGCRFAGRFQQF